MKIWATIVLGACLGLILAPFYFGAAVGQQNTDDFSNLDKRDVGTLFVDSQTQQPSPQDTDVFIDADKSDVEEGLAAARTEAKTKKAPKKHAAQDLVTQKSLDSFGYPDVLIISLIDYSPAGTQILIPGKIVRPGDYDEDELPINFAPPSPLEIESGTRLITFGASLVQGRQKINVIRTGADSRFTFGIVGGRTNPPVIGLDGIKLDVASCLKPGQTGLALLISDDLYIHRPADLKQKGPEDFRIKDIAIYPDAQFWHGKHSFDRLTSLVYDPTNNDYYCKKGPDSADVLTEALQE